MDVLCGLWKHGVACKCRSRSMLTLEVFHLHFFPLQKILVLNYLVISCLRCMHFIEANMENISHGCGRYICKDNNWRSVWCETWCNMMYVWSSVVILVQEVLSIRCLHFSVPKVAKGGELKVADGCGRFSYFSEVVKLLVWVSFYSILFRKRWSSYIVNLSFF